MLTDERGFRKLIREVELTFSDGFSLIQCSSLSYSFDWRLVMMYRQLGKTGEKVSAIGLGGHHIGRPKDPQEGIRIIHTAIDHGMTFMDNCWDYWEGESERRMGTALKDGGLRQRVFLMTKFDGRT